MMSRQCVTRDESDDDDRVFVVVFNTRLPVYPSIPLSILIDWLIDDAPVVCVRACVRSQS